MLKFYFNGSPNPSKVALFLEEAGLKYEAIPIDTRKGEQFKPAYQAVNPNGKVPAIVDGDVTVFDSNAILLYLAEKTGKFIPPNTPALRGTWGREGRRRQVDRCDHWRDSGGRRVRPARQAGDWRARRSARRHQEKLWAA